MVSEYFIVCVCHKIFNHFLAEKYLDYTLNANSGEIEYFFLPHNFEFFPEVELLGQKS